jgi:hypothetical protein
MLQSLRASCKIDTIANATTGGALMEEYVIFAGQSCLNAFIVANVAISRSAGDAARPGSKG